MKENESMPIERWREAVKAGSNASNYRRERGYTQTKDDYFVDGVQWADEHPTKDSFKKYPSWSLSIFRFTDILTYCISCFLTIFLSSTTLFLFQ